MQPVPAGPSVRPAFAAAPDGTVLGRRRRIAAPHSCLGTDSGQGVGRVKLLLTGFEPFGGATENPSQELLGVFRDKVATVLLPNAIRRAPEVLAKAVRHERPDVVLHLGESRESKSIIVERGAVNLLDTNIPDNDGNSTHGEAVVEGAPDFLPATVPVAAIVRAIRAVGIPVRLRSHGGTHVSNQVFYGLLHSGKVPRVGYIHIPPIQHRSRGPGMPLWRLALAVATAIGTLRAQDTSARHAPTHGVQRSLRRRAAW